VLWPAGAGWIRTVRVVFGSIPVEETPNDAKLQNQRLWRNPLTEAASLVSLDILNMELLRLVLPWKAAEKPLQDFAIAAEGLLAACGISNQGLELAQ